MTYIKQLLKLKNRFLTKLSCNDIYARLTLYIAVTAVAGIVIWYSGELFAFESKRLYAITGIALALLLKLLLVDLGSPSPFQYEDEKVQQGLLTMFNRFLGALNFLKRASVTRLGKSIRLNALPWYLLIGPTHSGKSSLLAHSNVNFVLQRHSTGQHSNCDWWVTRDSTIIDIPGKYVSSLAGLQSGYGVLWTFFLRLIRKYRGTTGLNGIIIALPLADIMHVDNKHVEIMLQSICAHIAEIQQQFPYPIPCQLVITKCDKLTGFTDYFNELADDEITQAWGLQLTDLEPQELVTEVFADRFNMLIKRLNQQLISRLHQERNTTARPVIKDFPIELERLKECLVEVIKKFIAPELNLSVQGLYLTSALQTATQINELAIENTTNSTRPALLFKKPYATSRAYFVKQFITHAVSSLRPETINPPAVWKKRMTYATSILVIGLSAFIFGKDFEHGIRKTYAIQNDITGYQLAIKQFNNPEEHLVKTLGLLNALQQSVEKTQFKFNFAHLPTFFSFKSQEKAKLAYQQALRTILLPEVKNYMEHYLNAASNRNADGAYAMLKSYLMLSDAAHLQPEYIGNTFHDLTPNFFTSEDAEKLNKHLQEAFNTNPHALLLSSEIIEKSRIMLITLPPVQLSFILLKNMNSNGTPIAIDLGFDSVNNTPFSSRRLHNQIARMYTAPSFTRILMKEIPLASNEALGGNWVLGSIDSSSRNLSDITTLNQQLQTAYVTKYANTWETVLADINITTPTDLLQAEKIIDKLVSANSSLLQVLHTVRDNTGFEQIIAISPKLFNLNSLADKTSPDQGLLTQMINGLESLQQYLKPVTNAGDQQKAAFDLLTARMQHNGTPDPITHVRVLAEKAPDPIKGWLNKLTDDTWRLMMESSGHYLNTAWQTHVYDYYTKEIANRYPFTADAESDVALSKFTEFFGNPGVLVSFYHHYLQNLVDTSGNEWHWKPITDGKSIFTNASLKQIQQAMRIQRTFFPNGDNKLFVRFALQPYQLSKQIARVELKINDKKMMDEKESANNPHVLMWPSASTVKMTSIEAVLKNNKTISKEFPGDWGWFKLVNQSLENSINRHQTVLDFSTNGIPAKYLFFTEGQYNAFLTPNFKNFDLPKQLIGKENA